jgi:hypothetical protein
MDMQADSVFDIFDRFFVSSRPGYHTPAEQDRKQNIRPHPLG